MKRVLLSILALGLVTSSSWADSSNLSMGSLIAHYVPELGYSSDPPACGWCLEYEATYAISSFEAQNNRIEEKVWCGTEFGFGDFNPAIFGFIEWAGCFPEGGGLEIPTAGWPGPNEGIAFVVTGTPWEGNFESVMWFGGYAYGNYGSGVIPIAIDPPTNFAGFSNCVTPPQPYEVPADRLGGLGINTDGIYVEPPPPPPHGACCVGFDCYEVPEEECIQMGGTWLGPDVLCEPNPCIPIPLGACCVPEPNMGLCVILEEDDCLLVQGEWLGPDTNCEPVNPCEGEWVCCLYEAYCIIVPTQYECEVGYNGVFHPEWDDCDPNPCCNISPTSNTTWGQLKSFFR